MKVPSISIIVPVYKVEKYLRRCVDSAREQSFTDLEIILVNDGSPDHCPEICEEYSAMDPRIKVLHKENGGLASARNAGLKIASGKYIFFLDSDDWLEKDGMELLFRTAEEQQVDFVRYRAMRTGWPGLPENAPCMVEAVREMPGGYYDKERIVREVYPRLLVTPQLTMGAVVGAWGSLYKRSFLEENQLYFYEEVKFSEDLVFSACVVRAAQSFYYIDAACVYHYFFNPDSISKSFRVGRWESCKSLITSCERDFGEIKEFDFRKQLYCLRWFCIFLALGERKFLAGHREKAAYCKAILADSVIRGTKLDLGIVDVSWKQKLLMVFVKLQLSGLIARI